MARAIRSAQLETRTARLKLPKQRKPHWVTIAGGISLGYRAGPGTWNVRAADGKGGNWIKSFGIADDHEDADGGKVLTFWQATERVRKLARGQDADAGRPVTVSESLNDYAADLAVRGAGAMNATRVRKHLPPSLLAKPVSLLTMRELWHWRNEFAKRRRASSVNRTCRAFKAALNFAAARDDRITNKAAWIVGLAALGEDDDTESNLILTDDQLRAVVVAAYATGPEFGLFVEVHAVTGQRTSQLALLDAGDVQNGGAARLMVPSSLKGRNRKTRTRKPVPIPPSLAKKLHAAAAGRAAGEPLLLRADGTRWRGVQHYRAFGQAAKAAGLPDGATIYALRHTAITRALLAGVPVRLAASWFDTSVAMIEKTYSKYITDHGDVLMRRGLFDADTPDGRNVIPLAPR